MDGELVRVFGFRVASDKVSACILLLIQILLLGMSRIVPNDVTADMHTWVICGAVWTVSVQGIMSIFGVSVAGRLNVQGED